MFKYAAASLGLVKEAKADTQLPSIQMPDVSKAIVAAAPAEGGKIKMYSPVGATSIWHSGC
jgi:hypothetical protein